MHLKRLRHFRLNRWQRRLDAGYHRRVENFLPELTRHFASSPSFFISQCNLTKAINGERVNHGLSLRDQLRVQSCNYSLVNLAREVLLRDYSYSRRVAHV